MVGSVGSCTTGSGCFEKRRESQRENMIDQKATVAKSGSVMSVAAQSPPLVMSENAHASAVTMTVIVSNWRSGSFMRAVCHCLDCACREGTPIRRPYNE